MSGARTTARLPVVFALALLTFIGTDLGEGRIYAQLRFSELGWSIAFALIFVGLALLWLRPPPAWRIPAAFVRWLGILPILTATIAMGLRGALHVGPHRDLGVVALLGLLAMIGGAVARRTPVILIGAVVAGLALRAFDFAVLPIDPSVSDVVPLVVVSLRRLLAGRSPYALYHFPWPVPLTYLPLGWLPFAPLFVLGADLRWTNPLAELSILGAIAFAARNKRSPDLRDAAFVMWAAWFVSRRLVNYDAQVVAPVQWAALAWVAAFAGEKNKWTPLVCGLAASTTMLTLPLLPTLAIAWHRAWYRPASKRPHRPPPTVRAGGKFAPLAPLAPLARAARAIALAAIVALVVVLPWALVDPREFFDGVYVWFNDLDYLPRMAWVNDRAWEQNPGFAGLFWTLHLERAMKPIQALAIFVLARRFARRTAATGPREALGGELVAVFLVFLLFNPMVWTYLWEPGLCLAMVALASSKSSKPLRSR